jgi:hypothetical protein
VKPRISNGVRRGLALLSTLGWGHFNDPSAPWKDLRAIERREFARALAWVEWQRTHNSKDQEVDVAPWPAKGRRRKVALEQIPLPLTYAPEQIITAGAQEPATAVDCPQENTPGRCVGSDQDVEMAV